MIFERMMDKYHGFIARFLKFNICDFDSINCRIKFTTLCIDFGGDITPIRPHGIMGPWCVAGLAHPGWVKDCKISFG